MIDFLWTSLSSPALDAGMAPLVVDAVALQASSKHIQSVSPKAQHQVAQLVDMLEAVAGASLDERPIYSFLHCTVSPLQHDAEVMDDGLTWCPPAHRLPDVACRSWARRRR